MPTPAKKAATPKRTPAKRAAKKAAPHVDRYGPPAPADPAPPQRKGDDLLIDLSPTMQDEADAHFRNLGKSGGYFHGTDADGRAIYKAID